MFTYSARETRVASRHPPHPLPAVHPRIPESQTATSLWSGSLSQNVDSLDHRRPSHSFRSSPTAITCPQNPLVRSNLQAVDYCSRPKQNSNQENSGPAGMADAGPLMKRCNGDVRASATARDSHQQPTANATPSTRLRKALPPPRLALLAQLNGSAVLARREKQPRAVGEAAVVLAFQGCII